MVPNGPPASIDVLLYTRVDALTLCAITHPHYSLAAIQSLRSVELLIVINYFNAPGVSYLHLLKDFLRKFPNNSVPWYSSMTLITMELITFESRVKLLHIQSLRMIK